MSEENNINSPLDNGKIDFKSYIEANCSSFSKCSFIASRKVDYSDNVNTDGDNKRLMQVHDYTANVFINREKKYCTVAPKLAGIVISSNIVHSLFNNRINQEPVESYEIIIKKAIDGKIIKAKFSNEDIANDRLFIAKLGVLSTLSYDEIKEFISKFVLKNNPKHIIQLKNPGRINFDKLEWIWENALYVNKNVYNIDEDGNNDSGLDHLYKIDKNTKKVLPKYLPNKKPVADILSELFDNIYEAWNGAIEPYLAFGFMSLSCYCPEFWKKEGFGVLAFVGDTEAGKTEITALGLGLYGYDKSFMASTRCTLVGIEQKMNSANCVPIIIDDLSKLRLTAECFIEEMKRISHGFIRDKGLSGQESGALPPCCTFGFSSNYLPCEKGEVLNRLLYLNTDNVKFNPQKYKYFGRAVEELSCILPHILNIGFNEVEKIHTRTKQFLLEKFPSASDRMLSQIAIAYTGLNIFQKISGEKSLKIPLKEKLPEYISKCIKRFQNSKSPIDKLIESFPILIWKRFITEGNEFKINQTAGMTTLTLFKTAVCLAYNKYVAENQDERINSRQIKEENGETYKILKFNKPEDIGGGKHHSIMIDITSHPMTPKIIEACGNLSNSNY